MSVTNPDIEEMQQLEQSGYMQLVEALASDNLLLQEQLRDFAIAEELIGWERLDGAASWEINRETLDRIVRQARMVDLRIPIIRHGINLVAFYTFTQGMTVRAAATAVNDVIQAFLDDPGNARTLTGPKARLQRAREIQTDGNLFVVLFTDRIYTGRV